jgi:phage-related protein
MDLIFTGFSVALMRGILLFLFNGFQKKTQKTPLKEIEKALRLKREYFELKNSRK